MKKIRNIIAAVSAAAAIFSMLPFSVRADYIPNPFPPLEDGVCTYQEDLDSGEIIVTVNNGCNTKEYRLNSSGSGTCREICDRYYVTADVENESDLPEGISVIGKAPMYADCETVCLYYGEAELNEDYFMTAVTAGRLANELIETDGIENVEVWVMSNPNPCFLYENYYTVLGSYEYDENDFTELVRKGYNVKESMYGDKGVYIEPAGIQTAYETMLDVMKLKMPDGVTLAPEILSTLIGGFEKADIYAKANIISVSYENASENIAGDLNGDNNVNVSDVVILQKYITKRLSSVADSADMNNDGRVDVFDFVMLKHMVLKKD